MRKINSIRILLSFLPLFFLSDQTISKKQLVCPVPPSWYEVDMDPISTSTASSYISLVLSKTGRIEKGDSINYTGSYIQDPNNNGDYVLAHNFIIVRRGKEMLNASLLNSMNNHPNSILLDGTGNLDGKVDCVVVEWGLPGNYIERGPNFELSIPGR